MFEFIRTHQRLMMLVLVILIIPPFVLFGIEGYIRVASGDDVLAKVEGQKITQQMFDQEQRRQFDQLRRSLGDEFNPAQFDTPELRQRLLDGLVRRRLTDITLQKDYLYSSDAAIREVLMSESVLQTNGKFDNEKYKTVLAARGLSVAAFEADLRREQTVRSYGSVAVATSFMPRTVMERLQSIALQQRQVQTLVLAPAAFADQVKIDDAAIKAYYEAHAKDFETPEQAEVEYVVLDLPTISAQVSLKEDEITTYYKQNQARFGTPEERRASHILIAVAADAKPEEKAKARKQAEEVLAKAKANPRDFGKLAQQYSQDLGSGAQNGDLGYFGRNMMAKPFEEAAFALKDKEISGIVETEFGFHIVQLTGIKPAQIKPLAEVRGQIEAEFRTSEATKKYAEAAEAFTNLVYDQSDSLKPAAERFGLKIQTAANIRRSGPVEGKSPVFTEKLLNALFSSDVIKNHRNTEAVEVAANTLVSARVKNYKPATRRELAEVQGEIKNILTQQEAQKLAAKAGAEKLAALQKQPSDQGFGEKEWVSRMAQKNIDAAAIKEIFKADARQLPAYAGIDLGSKGYAIYRITQVGTVIPDADKKAQLEEDIKRLGGTMGMTEQDAAYAVLKGRSKVKILRVPGAASSNS